MRLTDKPTPPTPGGIPPGPRRGKKPRRRGVPAVWSPRPARIETSTGLPTYLFYGAFVFLAMLVAFMAYRRSRLPVDRVFQAAPAVRTGTTAADVEAAAQELAAHRESVRAVFGDAMDSAKDSTDFDESPGWRKVAETMANLDPKFVSDRLEFSLNRYYDEVMQHPEAYRGRFVRMRGIVGSFRAYKLDTPLAGRTDVFRGQISDPEGTERVIFDLLDRPAEFRTQWDPVDVDAVFYRVVKFDTQSGRTVEVPWIIARTAVVPVTAPPPIPLSTGLAAIAVFLALASAIVYLFRRGKRPRAQPVGFREMFRRRLEDEQRGGPSGQENQDPRR